MIVEEFTMEEFEHIVLSGADLTATVETFEAYAAADERDAALMVAATTLQGYGFSPLDRLYADALATHERAIGAPLSDRETVRALAFELDRVAE
jgi:hypothetical protein